MPFLQIRQWYPNLRTKKGRNLHPLVRLITSDSAVRPVVPGCARLCPAWRSHPSPFQPYSSRARAQDDVRKLKQTPSSYYYYYYYYYYYCYYFYYYYYQ